MPKEISDSEISKIIKIYKQGNSIEKTANLTHKNISTVKKYIKMKSKIRSRSESAKIRPKRKLTNTHKKKIGKSNKNKKRTSKTKEKLSNAKRGKYGKKANNWKGGITTLNANIRHCFKNKSWTTSVFQRDKYTCVKCKQIGGELNAHHIRQFSTIVKTNNIKNMNDAIFCEELWDIKNGMTLCIKCHKREHKKR